MPVLPKTVGELRNFLGTYPDDLAVFVQGDTVENPNATPNAFVVEFWDTPYSDPPMLLLAGVPRNSNPVTKNKALDIIVEHTRNDPNASWNLPK